MEKRLEKIKRIQKISKIFNPEKSIQELDKEVLQLITLKDIMSPFNIHEVKKIDKKIEKIMREIVEREDE